MTPAFKKFSSKLLGINDSPQRIARGAGIGLFLGVFPGTGPIAALVCAFLFRANKTAALAGALAVNTWINVITFPLAIAIGGILSGSDAATISREWTDAVSPFTLTRFLTFLFHRAILSLLSGYAIIGLALGGAGYLTTYLVIVKIRRPHAS